MKLCYHTKGISPVILIQECAGKTIRLGTQDLDGTKIQMHGVLLPLSRFLRSEIAFLLSSQIHFWNC